MEKLLILLISTLLFGEKLYEKEVCEANRKAMENTKIKCRWVCDKKLYTQQKISEAISFYKHSKHYKFTKDGFKPL